MERFRAHRSESLRSATIDHMMAGDACRLPALIEEASTMFNGCIITSSWTAHSTQEGASTSCTIAIFRRSCTCRKIQHEAARGAHLHRRFAVAQRAATSRQRPARSAARSAAGLMDGVRHFVMELRLTVRTAGSSSNKDYGTGLVALPWSELTMKAYQFTSSRRTIWSHRPSP